MVHHEERTPVCVSEESSSVTLTCYMEKASKSSFVLWCRDDTDCFSYHCWTWDSPTHQDSDCESRAKSASGPGFGQSSFEPSARWLPLDLPLECCYKCQLPWWLKGNINIHDLTTENVVLQLKAWQNFWSNKETKHTSNPKVQKLKFRMLLYSLSAVVWAGVAAGLHIFKHKTHTSSWIHATVFTAVIVYITIGLHATTEDIKQRPW